MPIYKLRSDCYNLFLKGKWQRMKDLYLDNFGLLLSPHTVFDDNAIHLAVQSGNEELVAALLKMVYKDQKVFFLDIDMAALMGNKFGNTPLHEAASMGNVAIVKIIMEYDENQLDTKNRRGETPFFLAAAYGKTDVIKYLLTKIKKKPLEHHVSSETCSMLHEAIRGYYFETALELLDPKYNIQKNGDYNSGMTCFQLLANNPSAFKSGYPFGILEKLIYLCLPEDDYSKKKVVNNGVSEVPSPNTDLERGNSRNENVSQCPPGPFMPFQKIYVNLWNIIAKGIPYIRNLRDEKKKHGIAVEISKILAEEDNSWQNDGEIDTPLLAAARNGIREIIEAIFNLFPQAIEHKNHKEENILHVVVEHQRKKLLEYLLQTCYVSDSRILWKFNQEGDSILHKAASRSKYSSRERPGDALRLQSDIQWFERVKKLLPRHHINHLNKKQFTAKALFKIEHKDMVKNG